MSNKHNIPFRFVLAALLFVGGCKSGEHDEEIPIVVKPEVVELTSFSFKAAYNEGMVADVNCTIDGDTIRALLPSLQSADGLIPTFEGSYADITVGDNRQTSGVSTQNFGQKVTYVLTGKKGDRRSYTALIKVFTGLPIVHINTEGGQSVTDKDNYVAGKISISQTLAYPSPAYEGAMKVKGRGNATWNYPKKPYRIILDKKAELLGMPANKNWVLLAEYCDKSLLRTSYAFFLAELAGLPWTPRSRSVEFFMNGSYEGTYLMCEQVEVSSDRVNAADDGFLFEHDNYWNLEPLWFVTTNNHHYTFKYPDTDDMPEGENDPNYVWIRNYMNEFEAALYSDHFANPATGYRKYIDVESFARWYLVQETLGNIDTNPYFALESRAGKLKIYPVWDFEWSLGLAAIGTNGWASPPTTSPVERLYWRQLYFDRFFQDPYFVDAVKKLWPTLKNEWLPALAQRIAARKAELHYAQAKNFERWPILGTYISVGLIKFATWNEETAYCADFLKKRVEWLDTLMK